MRDLSATLRLQFHRDFTLDDATALVDYFADLGISHLYASPLLTARPGALAKLALPKTFLTQCKFLLANFVEGLLFRLLL